MMLLRCWILPLRYFSEKSTLSVPTLIAEALIRGGRPWGTATSGGKKLLEPESYGEGERSWVDSSTSARPWPGANSRRTNGLAQQPGQPATGASTPPPPTPHPAPHCVRGRLPGLPAQPPIRFELAPGPGRSG